MTKDTMDNIGTKFLTKTSEGAYKDIHKYFGVTATVMNKLVARKNCLFSEGGTYHLIEQYC
jgi:hypothetical protein